MIGAVVLAAGRSRRFGAENKLTAAVDGRPLVARVVEPLVDCGLAPLVVVVGFEAGAVRRALSGYPVEFVENRDFEAGMGGSLARGIEALAETGCAAALIALGDMPDLRRATVEALLAAHEASDGLGIVLPTMEGRRGHPVLFSRTFFPALAQCAGDRGAASVIAGNAGRVTAVAVTDPGIHRDVDRLGDHGPG